MKFKICCLGIVSAFVSLASLNYSATKITAEGLDENSQQALESVVKNSEKLEEEEIEPPIKFVKLVCYTDQGDKDAKEALKKLKKIPKINIEKLENNGRGHSMYKITGENIDKALEILRNDELS